MQNGTSHAVALPTGSWLAQERGRLGKTRADVAKAVHGHPGTVRAIEQNNLFIPPGWYQALRKLGVPIHEPVWPASMQPYSGADLQLEMQTRPGLRRTPFWLSNQLCVSESTVTAVLNSSLPVPHSWLPKLAELGANVPAQVRLALFPSAAEIEGQGPALPGSVNRGLDPGTRNEDPVADPGAARPLDPRSATGAVPAMGPSPPPPKPPVEAAPRERSSFSFHWTEDGGVHFSMSASLLNKIPDLLIRLHQLGLLDPARGHRTPASGA